MSIILATTWYPRGELPHLARVLPMLEEHYTRIVICLNPSDDASVQEQFTSGPYASDAHISFVLNTQRRQGRYLAIQNALQGPSDFIHYADMDRLVHWVETRREEWLHMLEQVEKADCTIFGRSEAAMATHPQSLITTEITSNRVVSHVLGREMDVSAGSKAFSRRAGEYLVQHGNPDNFSGADAEWPILLLRAGFSLQYIAVDGLDYESADQFKPRAATPEEQRQAAELYDRDPAHWAARVDIADKIIKSALETSQRKPEVVMEDKGQKDFDIKAVFDVDDYLYFYRETLTDERTEKEVSALVGLLEVDRPVKMLDLACGFGRHTNRLAALGHTMTGIDLTPGFLDIARHDAQDRNVQVDYRQGDMREIDFDKEFDRVLLVFTAFGYFSDDENLQVLVRIRKALKPGGLLVFDSHNRDAQTKSMLPYFVVEKEGNLMIDRYSFESMTGRWYNRRIVIRDGVRKDKPFFVRLYNASEIQALLVQAGLELFHIYASFDGQEFSADSRRMVVVARKPFGVPNY